VKKHDKLLKQKRVAASRMPEQEQSKKFNALVRD
jgi:hypothetical protein